MGIEGTAASIMRWALRAKRCVADVEIAEFLAECVRLREEFDDLTIENDAADDRACTLSASNLREAMVGRGRRA